MNTVRRQRGATESQGNKGSGERDKRQETGALGGNRVQGAGGKGRWSDTFFRDYTNKLIRFINIPFDGIAKIPMSTAVGFMCGL